MTKKLVPSALLTATVWLSLTLLASCLVLVTSLYVGDQQRERAKQLLLEQIAQRVNIPADWENVKYHIACVIAGPNRTKVDVENDLKLIDDYHIPESYQKSPSYVEYVFTDPTVFYEVYSVSIKYDADDLVSEVTIRETQGALESYTYREFDCSETP